jgi:hypothetical protein
MKTEPVDITYFFTLTVDLTLVCLKYLDLRMGCECNQQQLGFGVQLLALNNKPLWLCLTITTRLMAEV